jgi:transcriptional regulator with XRE-family HTH domain
VSQESQIAEQLQKFGRNVRKQRAAAGMTQERLAELAELNVRTIQKIEAGEVNILITTLARIADALKCSSDRLMTFR